MAGHGAAWLELQHEDTMRHTHEVCRSRMGTGSQNYFSWEHPRYSIPYGIAVRSLCGSEESERNIAQYKPEGTRSGNVCRLHEV